MSSTADQTSKNTSEISHCKLSIGFSLSWESMHFRHLASEEYDLFDPLNHVWEGVKKKKNRRRTTDWLSRKQSRRYSSEGDRREGRGRFAGRRAHSEEKKGRHFYFDFLTQTYDNSILLLFDWIVCRSHQKCCLKKLSSIKGDYSDHFQWFMLNYEKKIGHQSGFTDSHHVVFPQVRILIILKDLKLLFCTNMSLLWLNYVFIAIFMHYVWIIGAFSLLKTSPWEHSKGNQMQHNDSLCLTGLRS